MVHEGGKGGQNVQKLCTWFMDAPIKNVMILVKILTLFSVLRVLLRDNLESYLNNSYLVSSFLYFLNTSTMK